MLDDLTYRFKNLISQVFCRSSSTQQKETSHQFLLKKRLNSSLFDDFKQTTEIENSLLINIHKTSGFQEIHIFKRKRAENRPISVRKKSLSSLLSQHPHAKELSNINHGLNLDNENHTNNSVIVQETLSPEKVFKEISTTNRKTKFLIKTKVFSLEQNDQIEESNVAAQLNFNDDIIIPEAGKELEESPFKQKLLIEEVNYDPAVVNSFAKEKHYPLISKDQIYIINK
jgi:hypothetical protein